MPTAPLHALITAICLSASTLGVSPALARPDGDATASAYKSLAEKTGPALITIKCLLKFEGGPAGEMGDGREMEMTGVMIDPAGLLLCSNFKLGGFASSFGGGGGISVNPTDIRIFAGDEAKGGEGFKGKIITRDTDLDLCWVQIDDPKAAGKTFPTVDLSNRSTPGIGDRLITVGRRGKFFDHALIVEEGRVGGTATKPRKLLLPSGNAFSDLGMPVFTEDGKLAGIGVLQLPRREDMEGGDGSDMFDRMGGGGPVILPAEEVAKATARSKEAAKSASSGATGDGKPDEAKK